ncbi:unnamed protein product [Didymodactylos carnosus]|uniref:Uncharacterized protein n=1 Tax=Didymodactylos carnosus TaxID=1234261 RepID=A0A813S150_9BILA|nr:unnamed protein product [Didymodactylos carnosus]CAF0814865.1 unnamed protein product [Didymodactylos carnosus]CAF3573890.1 unnamed protein product [Didymodactylos carnosus]CAF3598844.1 unnamed protein product [Didymodactylos carnosus]
MIILYTLIIVLSFQITINLSSDIEFDRLTVLTDALKKTIYNPDDTTKLSFQNVLNLGNDQFNLDDILRLFIQQYILSLIDTRIDLMPKDWMEKYPKYNKVILEINQFLELLNQRLLGQITIRDIRPLIDSITDEFFLDLKQLIHDIRTAAEQEDQTTTKDEL